jgi:integrase
MSVSEIRPPYPGKAVRHPPDRDEALLFLYHEVLAVEVPWLDDVVRAKRPQRLPVVLTRDEVRAVLRRLEGVPRLMAHLLYGSGLRVLECCRLRVQDIDLARNQIVVHSAKGDKDRMTMLPATVKAALVRHLAEVREQHRADLAGEVPSGSSCRPPSRGSPPLVRHPPPRGPARHPDGPGASRPSRPRDHADLHSRPQPRSVRRPAPRRWDARRLTRATPAPIWSTKR